MKLEVDLDAIIIGARTLMMDGKTDRITALEKAIKDLTPRATDSMRYDIRRKIEKDKLDEPLKKMTPVQSAQVVMKGRVVRRTPQVQSRQHWLQQTEDRHESIHSEFDE